MVKKIAFDLHGVLDEHPVEMKPMIRMLEEINMEIHIVSGPTVKEIVKTLCDLHYQDYNFMRYITSRFHSVVDYLINRGETFTYDDNGNPWTDEQTWWTSKARICKEFGIDILVDDSLKYKPAFELTECKYIHIDELLKREDT